MRKLNLTNKSHDHQKDAESDLFSPPCQDDGVGLFRRQAPPPALYRGRLSEDVTSDEERMVICEEEGDDDVMGEWWSTVVSQVIVCFKKR